MLGHADLATTAMYLATDEKRLRQISSLGGLKNGGLNTAQAPPEQKDQGQKPRNQGTAPAPRARVSHRRSIAGARSGRP